MVNKRTTAKAAFAAALVGATMLGNTDVASALSQEHECALLGGWYYSAFPFVISHCFAEFSGVVYDRTCVQDRDRMVCWVTEVH